MPNPVQHLDPTSPEWARMWEALGGDDPAATCPDCGESWQYLGTETHPHPDAYRGIVTPGLYHCFRHRHHPRTKQREYAWIPYAPQEQP